MKQFMESDSDKQLELIELIISEAKERENEINNSIQKNQEELEKINSKLMQAKDINNLFEALELAHKKKEELDLRKDQMDLVWQQIDRGKKALQVEPKEASYLNKQRELSECSKRIEDLKAWLEKNEAKLAMLKKEKEDKEKEYKKKSPILASKISNINELLPKYEQLDKMTSEIKSLKEIKAITEEKYDKADKNVNKTKENKENLIKEQEELKSLADRYTHLELTVKNLDEKINSLKSLINLIKQLKSLLANYNQGEKDYKAADEDYDLKCKHYEIYIIISLRDKREYLPQV